MKGDYPAGVSVVNVPMENMAGACLQLIFELTAGNVRPPHSIHLPVSYIARETCGDA